MRKLLPFIGGILSTKISTLTEPVFTPRSPPLPPPRFSLSPPPPTLPSQPPQLPSHAYYLVVLPRCSPYLPSTIPSHISPTPLFKLPFPSLSLPITLPFQLHYYRFGSYKASKKEKRFQRKKEEEKKNEGPDDPKGLVFSVDPSKEGEEPYSIRFLRFVDDIRDALAEENEKEKWINEVRVLPHDPKKRFVHLTLESKVVSRSKGALVASVTLKVDRRNAYCVAVKIKDKWYRFKDVTLLDDDLEASIDTKFKPNYEDGDVKEREKIGSKLLQEAVRNLYFNSDSDSKIGVDKKTLMTIIVHVLEAARFTDIGEFIAGTTSMNSLSTRDFPNEFAGLINNWDKISKHLRNNEKKFEIEGCLMTLEEAKKKLKLVNSSKPPPDSKKGQ